MYVLLCGYPPFQGANENDIIENILKGAYEFIEEDWEMVSEEAKDLIKKMLEYEPEKRISA